MEFMKGIPDNYYELAIVDPPYGIVVNCLQFFIFTRFFAVFISKNLVNKGKELFISIKKTAKNILKYCFGSIFFVLIFIPNSAIESNL